MFPFERLQFYLKHSYNDLVVNSQRTIFGLFCISAGVAAIVGLLTLGVMVEDTLAGNLQESNRGDISITPQFDFEEDDEEDDPSAFAFSPEEVAEFTAWFAEQENVAVEDLCTDATDLCVTSQLSTTFSLIFPDDGGVDFAAIFAVDTNQYPLYGEIETDEGEDETPLAEALAHETAEEFRIPVV
jgi:hypothetical protein